MFMDFFSLINADPFEMEAKARECDAEVQQLEAVITELNSGSATIFLTWIGRAATDFDAAIKLQVKEVRDAQRDLNEAASALRKGAGQARAAIAEAKRKADAAKSKQSGG